LILSPDSAKQSFVVYFPALQFHLITAAYDFSFPANLDSSPATRRWGQHIPEGIRISLYGDLYRWDNWSAFADIKFVASIAGRLSFARIWDRLSERYRKRNN
jgi:hypothetical protein